MGGSNLASRCRQRQLRPHPRGEERGRALLRPNNSREWCGGQGDAFGFGAVRTPVFRREGDAPEARGRLEEFDTYFRLTGLHDPGSRYCRLKLLIRTQVADGEQLAHQNSLAQLQERAVRVDNRSADFFGKPLAIGVSTGHKNSDRQQDTLAAALVRILVKPRRTSTQLCSLVAGQMTGQEIPLAVRRSNLQTNAWESGEEDEGGLRLSRRDIKPNDFVEGTVDTAKIRIAGGKVKVFANRKNCSQVQFEHLGTGICWALRGKILDRRPGG